MKSNARKEKNARTEPMTVKRKQNSCCHRQWLVWGCHDVIVNLVREITVSHHHPSPPPPPPPRHPPLGHILCQVYQNACHMYSRVALLVSFSCPLHNDQGRVGSRRLVCQELCMAPRRIGSSHFAQTSHPRNTLCVSFQARCLFH